MDDRLTALTETIPVADHLLVENVAVGVSGFGGGVTMRLLASHQWATGSNLAFVSYAADPERNLVIAMGAVDNPGKGAACQKPRGWMAYLFGLDEGGPPAAIQVTSQVGSGPRAAWQDWDAYPAPCAFRTPSSTA